MNDTFEEVEDGLDVPKNAGLKGFLKAIEGILRLPRVQDIHINARGRVTYRYFLREGENKKPLEIDFATLMPYHVIRSGHVVELSDVSAHAACAVGQLFDKAAADHLYPIAFVGGAQTTFWDWYSKTEGMKLSSNEEIFGVPFLSERQLEDHMLILCAGYTRGSALIDCQKSYKLLIP